MTYKIRMKDCRIQLIDSKQLSKYKEEFTVLRDITWNFNDTAVKYFKENNIIKDLEGNKYKVSVEKIWNDRHIGYRMNNTNWG